MPHWNNAYELKGPFLSLLALNDGRLLFSGKDAASGSGQELWVTDGTPEGTHLLKDILPGAEGSVPGHFQPYGEGKAVFTANDGTHGRELWVTDGTAEGTRLLADLVTQGAGSMPSGGLVIDPGQADPSGLPVDVSPEPPAPAPGEDTDTVRNGGPGDDTVTGDDGDEILDGGGGQDQLEGGGGWDTAVFHQSAADYRLSLESDGRWKLEGAGGTTWMSGVEALQFSDRGWSLSREQRPQPVTNRDLLGGVAEADGGYTLLWDLWFDGLSLETFSAEGVPEIYWESYEYLNDMWGLGIAAARLNDGGLLIYGPVYPFGPLGWMTFEEDGEGFLNPTRWDVNRDIEFSVPRDLLALPDGSVLTAWTNIEGDISVRDDLFVQRLTPEGQAFGDPVAQGLPAWYSPLQDSVVKLTLLADGSVLASAWMKDNRNDQAVLVASVLASGSLQAGPVLTLQEAPLPGMFGSGHAVEALADGTFLLVGSWGGHVQARRYRPDGSVVGDDVVLGTGQGDGVRVATLANGELVAVWDTGLCRFTADGRLLQQTSPDLSASRYQLRVLLPLADGGFLVGWRDGALTRYDRSGVPVTDGETVPVLRGSGLGDYLNLESDGERVVVAGGQGNDTYVSHGQVEATEADGGGVDLLLSSVSATLGVGLENLTLTGDADVDGTGNYDDNILTGNGGRNVLTGGSGNDTYYVGRGDRVVEGSGRGIDTVVSDHAMALPDNVENLILTGSSNAGVMGNGGANVLTGNDGLNLMRGGGGDDTYRISQAGDRVREEAGEGRDLVEASISWTLGSQVERLLLTGSASLRGIGNELANELRGNDGANLLNGGLGDDTLSGGLGDETYLVDSAGDRIEELAEGGVDVVHARSDYTLAAHVERLYLMEGFAAVRGGGGDGDNVVVGNSLSNVLSGGLGDDRLYGRLGSDTYLFGRGDGHDTVTDQDARLVDNSDALVFGMGIAHDQLWFSRSGYNLEVSVIGTTDRVTVRGWFAGSENRVEEIRTEEGSKVLASGRVDALVTAMASLAPPASGQLTLSAEQHAALDGALAVTWS